MNEKVLLKIEGMHCESCEKIIGSELADLPGAGNIKIVADTGVGEFEVDSGVSDESILTAIKNAGYSGQITSRKMDHDMPVVYDQFEKKIVENSDSLKIKLQSSVTADGDFSTVDGKPSFKGKINHLRHGEFEIPKNRKDLNTAVDELINSSKISQLFSIFSGASVDQTVAPAEKLAVATTGTVQKNDVGGDKSVQLALSGMHCASCALLIERGLKKVNGVKTANVNYSAEKGRIIYDPALATVEQLIEVVKKTGYKARVADSANPEAERKERLAEMKGYANRFWWSFALSVPMMYFMFLDFFSFLPGRAILLPYIGIISLVLTIPVQFIIGAGFYKGMWSSLRMKTFNMDSLIAIGTSTAFLYSLWQFAIYILKTGTVIGI
ncbi:MAG: cation transporter, partial [Candidatus Magasanikbacteria bacterium]